MLDAKGDEQQHLTFPPPTWPQRSFGTHSRIQRPPKHQQNKRLFGKWPCILASWELGRNIIYTIMENVSIFLLDAEMLQLQDINGYFPITRGTVCRHICWMEGSMKTCQQFPWTSVSKSNLRATSQLSKTDTVTIAYKTVGPEQTSKWVWCKITCALNWIVSDPKIHDMSHLCAHVYPSLGH